MPNIEGSAKQQNKEKTWLWVKRSPNGILESELETRAGIQRRTLNNYLRELEYEGKIYRDGTLWLPLNFEGTRLRAFDLAPEEAYALYLATRLLVKQHDKRNEPAETALMKLAHILTSDAGVGEEIAQAAAELSSRHSDAGYQSVFRTLVRGYIYRKAVRLTYRPLNGKPFDTVFRTYLMEPSAIGFSTYAIGHSSRPNELRSYKVERIQAAELTRDSYAVPTDFPGLEILRNAWSIISGDETVRVVLRFSPQVKERVLETQWHPSQGHCDDSDKPDWLRWWVDVADTLDMLPWIRGWGGDCEVVGPAGLREELIAEVRHMTRVYGIDALPTDDPILQHALRCWGKTGKTDAEFHPAIFHMFDVANVAVVLLSAEAPSRFRRVLSLALNAEEQNLVDWLPWFVALHDIGKITASFQAQNATQKTRMQKEGFSFSGWSASDDKPHSIFSQVFIEDLLNQLEPSVSRSLQRAVADMIGGHHGEYQSRDIIKKAKALLGASEPQEWRALRGAVETVLRDSFLRRDLSTMPAPHNVSSAVMTLSGFTILCDWIGSDSRYFTPQSDMALERYAQQSKKRAQQAVRASGLLADSASTAPLSFAAFFSDVEEPRPLQLAIDEIPDHLLARPCLAIIEAPTGEGKTEAALALAHRIAQASQSDEFYYALPTMATSNQMFGRLQKHLQARLGVGTQIKLVHGQSFLIEDELRIEPLGNGGAKEQGESRTASLQWFNSKKRSLLAPFGVGTIDQAELAALNARHAALRMFGLAGKVVIIDEVHAYDTYMTTIIEQLLHWLAALNTSVILLSATLPLSRRAQLAEAYGVELDTTPGLNDAYPSLLVLSRNGIHHASPTAWQANRPIVLDTLFLDDEQVDEKARWLLDAISEGGCACWMTNTVKRAQRLFMKLQELAPTHVNLNLLHSQYPLEERQKWEEEVTGKYGPKGARPQCGIVVGTQVLEQSLDLDFDVLVSDLAPIDLLLQRAGRLHRHTRTRPGAHQTPRLWINLHRNEQPVIPPKADCAIYTEYILRQSWATLAGRDGISLPSDYRPLIEAVYDVPEPPKDSPLRAAWDKLKQKEDFATQEAQIRLLPDPNPVTPFSYGVTQRTFEENENSADWIVAQTRLGEESLNIIPVEVHEGFCILADGTRISLNAEVDREMQIKLLRRNLRISHPDAIQAIRTMNAKPCPLFKNSPLLKNYFLLPLTNGAAAVRQGRVMLTFTLHPRLGLMIERETK